MRIASVRLRRPWRTYALLFVFIGLTLCFFIGLRGFFLADLIAPEPSVLLLDRNQHFIAELNDNPDAGYGYWPLNVWPERVANALLVLEDQRFWQHSGVDFRAVGRAAWQNLLNRRRISGASTITMQVARMQNPKPRTYFNKSVEIATAMWLTVRYDRRDIMAHYLRLVPYGNNIHGIAYAAERYFNKPAADLSWAEIALLSAIPQSPTLNNPLKVSGRVRAENRARRSLQELFEADLISVAQYELALQQLPTLIFPRPEPRPRYAIHAIEKLQRELGRDQNHPLRVNSSLSLDLQRQVLTLASQRLSHWQNLGADNIAAVVIDNRTMEVLCWLGSTDYFSDQAGAIDYAQVARSPGSTFKPFIYALAFERNLINASTLLPDVQSVSLGIDNSDNLFLGPLLPRQALANSRNVPAINLVRQLGVDESVLFLEQLQLTQHRFAAHYYGAGIAIGTLPSSLEQLVRAYAVLANDGKFQALRWHQEQRPEPAKQLLSEDVSRQITLFLSDPSARLPSFPRMGTTEYNFPVAVKTGTSQGYRDAWTLAYNRDYTVGVWVGRSDAKPTNTLSGAGSAAQLTRDIFFHLYKQRQDFQHTDVFPPPRNYHLVNLCAYTGKRADEYCQQRSSEWLRADQIEEEDSFQDLPIDSRNGLLAGQWTPPEFVERHRFLSLPFLYQDWMKTMGWSSPPQQYSLLDNLNPDFYARGPSNLVQSSSPNQPNFSIDIVSPSNHLQVAKIPDLPTALNTLTFSVDVKNAAAGVGEIAQVLWYVDGVPKFLSPPPFNYHWPLQGGQHQVFAELPYYGVRSKVLSVTVSD